MATAQQKRAANVAAYQALSQEEKKARIQAATGGPKTTTPQSPSTAPSQPSISQPTYSTPGSSSSISQPSTPSNNHAQQIAQQGRADQPITMVRMVNGKEHTFNVVNDAAAKMWEGAGATRVSQAPQYTYYDAPSSYGVDSQGRPLTEQQWLGGGGLLDLSGKNELGAYKTHDGRYLDTSGMSAQQTHAATLWDDVTAGKRTAQDVAAILKGQGIDAYGNAVNPLYQGSSVYYLPGMVPQGQMAPSSVLGTSGSRGASGGASGSSFSTLAATGAGMSGAPSAGGGFSGVASAGGYGSLGQLTDSQKRAQDWIKNPASGFGDLNAYIQNNIERFRKGEISYKALKADAERVGYNIPSIDGFNRQDSEPTLPDYSWITEMVNNELAQQKTAIEQELARLQQANELAITQNNTFLQDSIKRLEENRIQAGNEIANYQNRRGGFYSGGFDYQMGANNQAFAEAQEDVSRDIAARNADIWNRNALLAQQAAEKLSMLQQQVPGRIQQLIMEQMERDRQFGLQEAGVTGMYGGQPTMAMQNQIFNQGIAMEQLGMQQQAHDLQNIQVMAALTGYLPNGQPTTAEQQRQLENLWSIADQTGRIPDQLADLYGIQRGTSTLQAKQVAIAQQNANTSAFSAQTSRMNATQNQKQYVNEGMAQVIEGFSAFNNAAEATAWLNRNAAEITGALGANVYQELLKLIPQYFGPDTSGQDAANAQKLRQQAVTMAQKDHRWLDQKTDKESIIQEYMRMLSGS